MEQRPLPNDAFPVPEAVEPRLELVPVVEDPAALDEVDIDEVDVDEVEVEDAEADADPDEVHALVPAVTVVNHSGADVGRAAAARLAERILDSASPAVRIDVPVALIPRGSGELLP